MEHNSSCTETDSSEMPCDSVHLQQISWVCDNPANKYCGAWNKTQQPVNCALFLPIKRFLLHQAELTWEMC